MTFYCSFYFFVCLASDMRKCGNRILARAKNIKPKTEHKLTLLFVHFASVCVCVCVCVLFLQRCLIYTEYYINYD